MRTISLSFLAGQQIEVNQSCDVFYLLECDFPVDIQLAKFGATKDSASQVEFGYWIKPKGGYDKVIITSATAQTIKIAVGVGDVGYNRTSGVVQIIGNSGSFTQSTMAVTNAVGGVQLIAPRAAPQFTLIQNNDSSGQLRVTLDGSAPSATHGLLILPGADLPLDKFNPTGAVMAWSSIASNPNVEVISA